MSLTETEENSKKGKKSKQSGAEFERRVRQDLEEKGWVVAKWGNNVEFPEENINLPPEQRIGKLIPAKNKWIKSKFGWMPTMLTSGFPDFVAFKHIENSQLNGYELIGVESKVNGQLDRMEKDKCGWLLENKIFSKILVAKKTKVKNKIVVEYKEFEIQNNFVLF